MKMNRNDRLEFDGEMKGTASIIKKMLQEDKPTQRAAEIINVPIDLIDHLKSFEHPFDKTVFLGLEELAEKIKLTGVLEPVTLRPGSGGRYELLAGHRRTEASKLAGLTYVPAIIRECDIDTAKLIVTDTNLERREKILPSEKAKAYKLQMEALKNQGKRTDLVQSIEKNNFGSSGPEVKSDSDNAKNNLWSTGPQVKSRDIIAENNGTSAKQISRYLRLNELIEPILNLVDDEEIALRAAVAISYLRITEQQNLFDLLQENQNIKITIEIAEALKTASKDMELSKIIMDAVINPEQEESAPEASLKPQKPKYKAVIKHVEKYMKKIETGRAEKLELIDETELEHRITAVINEYLDSI